MALKHKALEFEARPVCMSDKAAIAFSGGKTVPVISDGESVVRDSWRSREHLESRYPDKPLFGGDIARGVTHAFNTWVDRALCPPLMPVIVLRSLPTGRSGDDAFFRRQFEGFLNRHSKKPARAAPNSPATRPPAGVAGGSEAPGVRCGAAPRTRLFLFSLFRGGLVATAGTSSTVGTPLDAWRGRVLELYDGFARDVPLRS